MPGGGSEVVGRLCCRRTSRAGLDGPANLGGLCRRQTVPGGASCWKDSRPLWRQAPGDAAGRETARRRAAQVSAAPGAAAAGLRTGRCGCGAARGGVGDRRVGESRDGPADAKKNGVTGRKVAPAEGRRRVYGAHGAGAGRLREALRRHLAGAVHGRAADPAGAGDAMPDSGHASAPARRRSSSSRWRRATARPRRTKADWAREVGELLEGRYADCERITLVPTIQHAHPGRLLRSVRARPGTRDGAPHRVCHTPKHGSWLNVAESELSCMTRQCLKHRRFGDIETLRSEIAAWSADINDTQRGVDWQMTSAMPAAN